MTIDAISNVSVAVVIPCFNVKSKISDVINLIDPAVKKIYVVDDCCPEQTGKFVAATYTDKRISIITHDCNLGVGGAVISGYREALNDNMDIVVKIDGDGQMDPRLICYFIDPIITGEADYTKGNRFFDLDQIGQMPKIRLVGNACLSFLNKLSSGYWDIFDPTNGYTAIHCDIIRQLPLDKINRRYFFESDMLFRLNTIRAAVIDVPMHAFYGDEKSNLIIRDILFDFSYNHIRNSLKRIFYNYYLRDLSLASFELPVGLILLIFGLMYGIISWWHSALWNIPATAGTVMLASLPIIMGVQFILAFIGYDISSVPRRSIHRKKLINLKDVS